MTSGMAASTISPPMAPVMTVSFISFLAPSRASSSLFSPMMFPRRMPPALAMPKQRMVPKLRTTTTKELAATASVPRWPMITEYMEKATLQLMSFPSAGRDRRTKSENSSLLRAKMYRRFRCTSLLRTDTTMQAASSTSRDRLVARATPMAPSLGAPKRPKIHTALRMMFREKASTFITVLMTTRLMLRSTAR